MVMRIQYGGNTLNSLSDVIGTFCLEDNWTMWIGGGGGSTLVIRGTVIITLIYRLVIEMNRYYLSIKSKLIIQVF